MTLRPAILILLPFCALAQMPPLPPAVPAKAVVVQVQSPHAASNPAAVQMVVAPTNWPRVLTLYVSTPFVVETSTNLADWQSFSNVNQTISLTATNPCQFFRVSQYCHLSWTPSPDAPNTKIYAGTSSGQYVKVWDVGGNDDCFVRMMPGTNYFAATAYLNAAGNLVESDFSNEASVADSHPVIRMQ